MTSAPFNFENNYTGKATAGNIICPTWIDVIVTSEGQSESYHILEDQYDEFVGWVATVWERRESPMDTRNESDVEYLERIKVDLQILD